MLFTLVWVLAGVTAWCVASLALALFVGPLLRASEQKRETARPAGLAVQQSLAQPLQLSR
jgi:hypothetical protein